jgi:hypothetical protein
VPAKAEEVADGQADDPVADDLDDEAGVCISSTAKGAGGSDLEAVEELEDGGDEEQRDGGGDDAGIFRERAGDEVRADEDNGGEGRHRSGSERDGGPPSRGGFARGLATYGLSDADRCSR